MEGRQVSRTLTEGTAHGREGSYQELEVADSIVSIIRKQMRLNDDAWLAFCFLHPGTQVHGMMLLILKVCLPRAVNPI